MKQTTILKAVETTGIGLHKGLPIKIRLEPLEANSGIIFERSDLGISFKASYENVINTQMATVIGNDKGYISTVEHLLSAVSAYGIDNLKIIVNANEPPVLDGSSIGFCSMLDEAGIKELDAKKKIMIIKKEVIVKDGDKYAKLMPTSSPKLDFTIRFDSSVIGEQQYVFHFNKKNYIEQIAGARTFGFLKDVEALKKANLGLGGSLDNAIIIDDDKVLNPDGLRYEDEFVRHKILDAIGDLSLLGCRVFGDYESFAGSHKLNHLLTKEIISNPSAYEIVELEEDSIKVYEKALV